VLRKSFNREGDFRRRARVKRLLQKSFSSGWKAVDSAMHGNFARSPLHNEAAAGQAGGKGELSTRTEEESFGKTAGLSND